MSLPFFWSHTASGDFSCKQQTEKKKCLTKMCRHHKDVEKSPTCQIKHKILSSCKAQLNLQNWYMQIYIDDRWNGTFLAYFASHQCDLVYPTQTWISRFVNLRRCSFGANKTAMRNRKYYYIKWHMLFHLHTCSYSLANSHTKWAIFKVRSLTIYRHWVFRDLLSDKLLAPADKRVLN